MKFSICIPNYNYGRYIGQTIASVLEQDADVEVLVADNHSTDDSAEVVESFADPRVKLTINPVNLGFAANLDRACAGATGDRMILLSSDDVAGPNALGVYRKLAEALGEAGGRAVFASDQHVIDGDGETTGRSGIIARLWAGAREDASLSAATGERVLRMPAAELLRRSMGELRVPFAFATTCYPRALYERVGGYANGHLINPDKPFAWKLLAAADETVFVDAPLFQYRVHAANQGALQQQSGALKHLVDQYRLTFDTPPYILERAGMARADLERAFVEHDIALRGMQMVARGQRALARRGVAFGMAAYPAAMRRSSRVAALRALLAAGPIGTSVAAAFEKRALERFNRS